MKHRNIILLASLSRLVALALWILSDWAISDHIPSGAAQYPMQPTDAVFISFTRWDAAHYLTVADKGYTSEQSFAFFPVFPLLIAATSKLIGFVSAGYLTHEATFVVSGLFISNAFFIASAVLLYHFSLALCNDAKIARTSLLLYCVNPASVFHSAVYTESLFSFFSLLALLLHNRGLLLYSSAPFLLASGVRSNGVLSAVVVIVEAILSKNRLPAKLFLLICIVIPSVSWNFYTYSVLCHGDNLSDGCSECSELFPNMYSYLQRKHWDVGFFRQYKLKQLPNFILASPAIMFSCLFIKRELTPRTFTGGHFIEYLPYILHLICIVAVGVFYSHVQISTRLIFSSCPVVYILFSKLYLEYSNKNSDAQKLSPVLIYFLVYYVVGIVLHSNFYPWT